MNPCWLIGQPIALVIAKNAEIARIATRAIAIEFEQRPAIFDAREAYAYLETQSVLAYPTENEGLKVISSTQSPMYVQHKIAGVLNMPMHKIEVDVLRLGGGFGGKETQATPWAVMTALAAFKLKKAIKRVLNRDEDMRMTGKRYPYSSDFKMGLSHDGQILAYEVIFYQNAGASADLSSAALKRSLFHATNSYFMRIKG